MPAKVRDNMSLTTGQVADIFGVSIHTVKKWCRKGLPHHSIPFSGDRRIAMSDAVAWASGHGMFPIRLSHYLWAGDPNHLLVQSLSLIAAPYKLAFAENVWAVGEIVGSKIIAGAVFHLDEWQDVYARDSIVALRARIDRVPIVVIARDDGVSDWYAANGVAVVNKQVDAATLARLLGLGAARVA